ncbi:CBN-DOP-3 protein [Aphelenchoides fujianensis]|nr:CBN-DOP-3 protein [Aphelenchoides fujianensis]
MNLGCPEGDVFCRTTGSWAIGVVDSTIASLEDVQPPPSNTKPLSLLLLIIPILTVFGNGMVIAAVYRERSLQTVTNLLIVSLAVSDLLVAVCVMSFAVYFEWNDFVWDLGAGPCASCTLEWTLRARRPPSSIFSLFALIGTLQSAIPLAYAQYGTRNSRAFLSIGVVWIVSISVALARLSRRQSNRQQQTSRLFCLSIVIQGLQQCEFTNAYFIIFSSLLSFFLPCAAMILLVHARERARYLRHMAPSQSRIDSDHISTALLSGAQVAQQVGKHLKRQADQLFYDYSYATSSYPTLSGSSDDLSSCRQPMNEQMRNSTSQHTPVDVPTCPTRMTIGPSTSSDDTPPATPPFVPRCFGDDLAENLPFIDSLSQASLDFDTTITAELSQKPVQEQQEEANGVLTFDFTGEGATNQHCHLQLPPMHLNADTYDPFSLPATSPRATRRWWRSNAIDGGSFKNTVESSKSLSLSRRTSLTSREKQGGFLRRLFGGFRFNKKPSRHLVKKATRQMKREQKATITLAILCSSSVGSRSSRFHLSNALCIIAYQTNCVHFLMTFLTTWLGYCNSCANCVIYTVFDHRFRRAFKNIIHR